MTRKKLAVDIGRSLSLKLFNDFKDMDNRGPKFVWPDSLRRFVDSEVKTQALINNLTKYEEDMSVAARKELDILLDINTSLKGVEDIENEINIVFENDSNESKE